MLIDCYGPSCEQLFLAKKIEILKVAEGEKENGMGWTSFFVAFGCFLYGSAFSEDWLGMDTQLFEHPELYLLPFLVWAVIEICRPCCRRGPRHHTTKHMATSTPKAINWTELRAKHHKQKSMVAAMKAKYSPNRPAPLSLQERWATGYQGP